MIQQEEFVAVCAATERKKLVMSEQSGTYRLPLEVTRNSQFELLLIAEQRKALTDSELTTWVRKLRAARGTLDDLPVTLLKIASDSKRILADAKVSNFRELLDLGAQALIDAGMRLRALELLRDELKRWGLTLKA